ncbi:MAG: hypothetical protein U9Q58_03125, partial [Pseudomonadota bacterium]|nr:hypothetical protein [Pseudomonadota bacterium]
MKKRGRLSRTDRPSELRQRRIAGVKAASTVRTFSLFTVVSRRGWQMLLLFFFMISPLVFVSGYDPSGRIFCTLYTLPKAYFIATCILLFCLFYSFNLFRKSEQRTGFQFFLHHSRGLKIVALFFLFPAFSLSQALVREAAIYSFINYLLLGLFFMVLVQLFARQELRWAAIYGLIGALAVFSFFGIVQFFGYKIPFLIPILGPASTFGYRNPAAQFIALVIPFVIFAGWRHWRLWRLKGTNIQFSIFF